MGFSKSLDGALLLDAQDSLRAFRNEFLLPQVNGRDAIYFLGNSLGLQPKRTEGYIKKVLVQWQQFGVEGFFNGDTPWLAYHNRLAAPLAAVVGALPQEVVVMNQLTVNLHLMLVSFYRPSGKRTKILCEAKAFPSDQYMLETHLLHRGFDPDSHIIEVAPRAGDTCIRPEDILHAIETHGDELAVVLWGGVNYYTGQVFDMKSITEAAQKKGALVGFDLAHAAGNVPLELHNWNVDFAGWCNYKYLNAGPGAVAAAFIHERHHYDKTLHRFAGWWGYKKEDRFLMQKGFQPILSAEGWALSTPSPVLFAQLEASLELFAEAGMEKLVQKSRLLTAYLFYLLKNINTILAEPVLQILTPTAEEERGSQISILAKKRGRAVFDHLAQNGVFADWREPDVIRIAPVSLYNSFEDVWRFGAILETAFAKASFSDT
jgi:kynureninase